MTFNSIEWIQEGVKEVEEAKPVEVPFNSIEWILNLHGVSHVVTVRPYLSIPLNGFA